MEADQQIVAFADLEPCVLSLKMTPSLLCLITY